MTKEEALEKLKEVSIPGDPEIFHSIADGVLCDLLKSLGCDKVVEEWEKVDKWYA